MKSEPQDGKTEPAFQATVGDFVSGKGSSNDANHANPLLRFGNKVATCGRLPVGTLRCDVPAGAFPVLASGISEPPAKSWKARAGTAQRAIPTQTGTRIARMNTVFHIKARRAGIFVESDSPMVLAPFRSDNLERATRLRQSIQQKTFTGKLI